ncbi:MAG: fibronectin type III domain-containing protein, partial [Chitinophagaceae bacterium]|nr:fibronectin type III domain-containing protein [Chitinophagaceae bacterium]
MKMFGRPLICMLLLFTMQFQLHTFAQTGINPGFVAEEGLHTASPVFRNPIAAEQPYNTVEMTESRAVVNESLTHRVALSGNYTIGVGGDYPTITAAVAAYNSSALTGPVVFTLINTSYPSETFPVTIGANPGASSTNTLTIKPSLPGTVISGSVAGALLVLNGADHIIIDGSVSNSTNTICPLASASRDLKIENTANSSAAAVIWLQNNGSDGATHNSIRNLIVAGNSGTTTLFGIGCAGPAIDLTSFGSGNHFNSYINNSITRVQYGIYSQGAGLADMNSGTVINQNRLDAAAPDNIGTGGILAGYEDNLVVSGNTISEIVSTSGVSVFGIGVGLGMGQYVPLFYTTWRGRDVTNASVTNNKIGRIINTHAYSAIGIAVSGSLSGTTYLANNLISGVGGNGNGDFFTAGIYLGGIGIGTSGSFNVVHNTVAMTTDFATGFSLLTAAIAIADDDPFVNLKNNILIVTANLPVTYNRAIAFYSTTFTNLNSDNNCIYVSPGPNSAYVQWSGLVSGSFSTTLQGWQTFSGKDLNSKNILPAFVSSSDVHLLSYAGVNLNHLGNTGMNVGVNEDIDCQSRTAGPLPDIGADEFSFAPVITCNTPSLPVISSIGSNSITVDLPVTGSYLVEYGPDNFVPGLGASAGASSQLIGPANTSVQITGLSPTTYYKIVVRQQCAGPVWSENSPAALVRTKTANDECTSAIAFPAIPVNGTCVTLLNQTNAGATQSQVSCSGSLTAEDIWYSFVATTPVMKCTLTKLTGVSNTIIREIFSGSCGSLTSINCWGLDFPVTYSGLVPGNTYYLRVYSNVSATVSTFDLCIQAVPCTTPTSLSATNILSTSAVLNWTELSNAVSWDIEIQPSPYNFTGTPTVTAITKPYTITGLIAQTGYQFKVRPTGCIANWSAAGGFSTTPTPPANDEAPGAVLLPFGACTSGFGHTNRNATQSPGEPFPSCRGTEGYSTVWFKFIAPPSGGVKISNDYFSGSGSNIQTNDTRIALFSATNVNDYSTFTMIACGDDGAINVVGRTIFYATGLTPGNTYYLQEDGCQPNHIRGQFCISVEDLASGGMISGLTSCAAARTVTANSNFTEWLSITDNTGRLVAMVRNPNGSGAGTTTYTTNLNINSGPVRSVSGSYYLDRNFQISNPGVANAEIRFFYLNNELNALTTANPLVNASTIGVLRQPGASCNGDLSLANGTVQFLPQTGNGVSPDGTLRWINVSTPGFSNFYLSGSIGSALPIDLLSFAGQREGSVNKLSWTTASEQNNRGFDVQRSADGITYESIGFVNTLAPGGNSTGQLSYNFTDNTVGGRKLYYRLRQMDTDGRSKLSSVVLIKGDKPVTLAIDGLYPNPANTRVNVVVGAPVRDKVTLLVVDMTGKTVLQKVVNVEAGSNTVPFDISQLT